MQKGDGFSKNDFIRYVEALPEKKQDKCEKINVNNVVDVPFDRQDPNLTFFRQSIQIQIKTELLTKFGWKIAHLEKEQEDLTIQCCSLLQTQLLYPVTVFTNHIEPTEATHLAQSPVKCLWMQAEMHRGADSKEMAALNKNSQYTKMFDFYEKKLLPMISDFIKNHLDWQRMVSHTHDRHTILNLFEKEVIAAANEIILASSKEAQK